MLHMIPLMDVPYVFYMFEKHLCNDHHSPYSIVYNNTHNTDTQIQIANFCHLTAFDYPSYLIYSSAMKLIAEQHWVTTNSKRPLQNPNGMLKICCSRNIRHKTQGTKVQRN